MQLCIRAHDLGVKGTEDILSRLDAWGLDGVQMVCYKAYDNIPYAPGAIAAEQAQAIGKAFSDAGKCIPLIGAYFNPVHSDRAKAARCEQIFADYLRVGAAMGCPVVGSETGSFNDEPWTYKPRNRTPEALRMVADTFSRLCDTAAEAGAWVAMEGAAGHCCWNVDALETVQRMMGRDNVRVIFDLFNYLDETNTADSLSILQHGLEVFGEKILLFHMKDWVVDAGGRPVQVPLGTGQADMQAILKQIKAFREDAVLVLEGTTGADIPHAVKTIREIWESI